MPAPSRSPQGERGLKSLLEGMSIKEIRSLSARRAWIEILRAQIYDKTKKSLSARRAWIEIAPIHNRISNHSVALRKESVD